MRASKLVIRAAAVVVGLAMLAPLSTLAQAIPASTGTTPVISTTPPAPGEGRISVPRHGRSGTALMFARVRDGVYTVDGMVAKVQLNYDINGANHLYLFVPGLGTAVLGLIPDTDQGDTLAHLGGKELTFDSGDHHFKLTGIALVNDHGSVPDKVYVHLDRNAWNLSRRAMVGYGDTAEAPYVWPGAITPVSNPKAGTEDALAPPVPRSLLPSTQALVPAAAPTPVAVNPTALRSGSSLH